jgi:hypothetical protein
MIAMMINLGSLSNAGLVIFFACAFVLGVLVADRIFGGSRDADDAQ